MTFADAVVQVLVQKRLQKQKLKIKLNDRDRETSGSGSKQGHAIVGTIALEPTMKLRRPLEPPLRDASPEAKEEKEEVNRLKE